MVSFQLYFIVKEGMNEQTKDWRNRGTLTLHRTQNFAVMVFITKTIQHWEIFCWLISIFSYGLYFTSTSYRHFSRIFPKICKCLFRKSLKLQKTRKAPGPYLQVLNPSFPVAMRTGKKEQKIFVRICTYGYFYFLGNGQFSECLLFF